jgi:hypothetical protein
MELAMSTNIITGAVHVTCDQKVMVTLTGLVVRVDKQHLRPLEQ